MKEFNTLDKYDNTPLMLAAAKGNLTKVKELLSLGADPNIQDNFGMTALSRAKNLGHNNIIEYLEDVMNGNKIVEMDEVVRKKIQEEQTKKEALDIKIDEPTLKIKNVKPESNVSITGVSSVSYAFLMLVQIVFWIAIIGSIYIGNTLNFVTGMIFAVSSILSCGLIFILGDILKNLAEINKKTRS